MNRPRIVNVGAVTEDLESEEIRIHGWGLGPCAANCACHRHPETNQLSLLEDAVNGRLGLTTYRDDCECCEPWTVEELAAVVSDLRSISDWEDTA